MTAKRRQGISALKILIPLPYGIAPSGMTFSLFASAVLFVTDNPFWMSSCFRERESYVLQKTQTNNPALSLTAIILNQLKIGAI
ncbi:hypothetical protein BEL04_18125 [Mucilaginibacter sp. PPCGB 2223]|nr:hypothetical protein BEL04_18125 [Mucilaginibacter sp. PPCGB 2223]